MVIKWTTVAPVIARITRNIRTIDASYMLDLKDWIGEAIMKMTTHQQMELKMEKLEVNFFIAKLPCALEAVAAVVSNNKRMLPSDISGPVAALNILDQNLFKAVIGTPPNISPIEQTSPTSYPVNSTAIIPYSSLDVDTMNYYRFNYNKIETSFETGSIDLWYWDLPKDRNGFLLIPDNENYQTAIYWYVRMMLIGSGFTDTVFRYEECEGYWRVYANRAINEITYPSPDEKQRNIVNSVHLMPNDSYWESFGG